MLRNLKEIVLSWIRLQHAILSVAQTEFPVCIPAFKLAQSCLFMFVYVNCLFSCTAAKTNTPPFYSFSFFTHPWIYILQCSNPWGQLTCLHTVRCSDFGFSTFWGIKTHPLHPKGPKIWKLAKKISTSSMARENVWQKPDNGIISKFNFRKPVWRIFNIFSACYIYGIFNTHTKI